MDIDALHSALFSLTVLPEQIRSARDNVSRVNGGPSAFGEFLGGMERDLRLAKATLARELGFPVCQCCWPPELMLFDGNGIASCPVAGKGNSFHKPKLGGIPKANGRARRDTVVSERRKPLRNQRLAA
jgi:hypothetical protein